MKTKSEMNIAENTKNENSENGSDFNMESFTHKLKKEDNYNLNISKTFYRIYIGFVSFYFLMMVAYVIFDRGMIRIITQLCFIISFIVFALVFRYNLKIFNKIDYSLPIAEMLKGVVKRYQLRLNYFLIILIPILLIDAALTLTFYEDLLPMSPINRVLIVQVFYIPIITISVIIGVYIWRKKQKPLRDKALELLKELES